MANDELTARSGYQTQDRTAPIELCTAAAAIREAAVLLRQGYWVRVIRRPDEMRKYIVISKEAKEPEAGLQSHSP